MFCCHEGCVYCDELTSTSFENALRDLFMYKYLIGRVRYFVIFLLFRQDLPVLYMFDVNYVNTVLRPVLITAGKGFILTGEINTLELFN